MSKSLLVNFIALLFVVGSFFVPQGYRDLLWFTGLFALSGAITNQIAIYMLFERVPFLYGSGIIEKNFESFKASIGTMVIQEFFSKENLTDFLSNEEQNIELAPLVEGANFSPAFDALSQTVMASKFGGAITMFGGEEALEGLREPFITKLKSAVIKIVSSETFKAELQTHMQDSIMSDEMIEKIKALINRRLESLTPSMVKRLVKELIHAHLGWLVVWGGVFGGMIGAMSSLFDIN